MIREIIIYPDSALKRVSAPVTTFDDDLRTLLSDMAATMQNAKGAGLAAIQVGVALRAITILVRPKGGEPEVLKLVNPKIVERTGSQLIREGCLSLPGLFDMVRRSTWVKVEAQDENGAKVEVSGDGVLGHALQHELDHLDGTVFVDHLSTMKRSMAAASFKKAKAKGLRYASDRPEPKDFTEQVVH